MPTKRAAAQPDSQAEMERELTVDRTRVRTSVVGKRSRGGGSKPKMAEGLFKSVKKSAGQRYHVQAGGQQR